MSSLRPPCRRSPRCARSTFAAPSVCGIGMCSPFETICVGTGECRSRLVGPGQFASCSSLSQTSSSRSPRVVIPLLLRPRRAVHDEHIVAPRSSGRAEGQPQSAEEAPAWLSASFSPSPSPFDVLQNGGCIARPRPRSGHDGEPRCDRDRRRRDRHVGRLSPREARGAQSVLLLERQTSAPARPPSRPASCAPTTRCARTSSSRRRSWNAFNDFAAYLEDDEASCGPGEVRLPHQCGRRRQAGALRASLKQQEEQACASEYLDRKAASALLPIASFDDAALIGFEPDAGFADAYMVATSFAQERAPPRREDQGRRRRSNAW